MTSKWNRELGMVPSVKDDDDLDWMDVGMED